MPLPELSKQKIALAIKTMNRAPRPNYLGSTIENMVRAGVFASPFLHSLQIIDSGSPDEMSFFRSEIGLRVPVAARQLVSIDAAPEGQPRTLHQTAASAIRLASATDADWVLVLEDDLDFCADFLEGVIGWLNDHEGLSIMYAFGASYAQVTAAAHYGRTMWSYPVHAFYGAQALAWTRADAAQCADWLGPDPSFHGKRTRGHDLLLQEWARSRGCLRFLASAPSFVQHMGVVTTVSTSYFRFKSWPGRQWRYRHTGVCRVAPGPIEGVGGGHA